MRLACMLLVVTLSVAGVALAKPEGEPIGEYKGITAFSNGENTGTGAGLRKHQCVALVRRYLRTFTPAVELPTFQEGKEEAKYVFELAKNDSRFKVFPNGSKDPPQEGDILCYNNHVEIVSSPVFVSADRATLRAFAQNVSAESAFRTVKLVVQDGEYWIEAGRNLAPQGWLRVASESVQGTREEVRGALVEPAFVMIVLDMSKNMSLEHTDTSHALLQALMGRLRPQTETAIVAFGDKSLQIMGIDPAGNNKKFVNGMFARRYQPRGSANVAAGLHQSMGVVSHIQKPVHLVVITASSHLQGDASLYIAECKRKGWPISVIALTPVVDPYATKKLTSQTGGTILEHKGDCETTVTQFLEIMDSSLRTK